MGFSDIGCYGGEIPTPYIDSLAANGLRFAQFYNSARCSPTRAALLTGLLQHQTGMGILGEDPNQAAPSDAAAGYTRRLNNQCVTLAELLKENGYHTYMAGKWHLGYHEQSTWPRQRGFDRFYGILAGATSYFQPNAPRGLTLDNNPQSKPSDSNYYTTDAFTDHLIQFIREQPDNEPFFGYLAFNAPHWPLHAREEDIAKFVGKYSQGWDRIRESRWKKQVDLGVVQQKWGLSKRDDGARQWDSLSDQQQKQLDYRMAVYAAQVHRMDYQIGRVIEFLKEKNKLDNTMILFLSDNGGCAEPYTDLGGGKFDEINVPEKNGAVSYGTGWANASNTPFRHYKAKLYEGGISTPLIIHWPSGLKTSPGAITQTRGYLSDIVPTVLEITGTNYPQEFHGHRIHPLYGRSFAPVLDGKSIEQPEWMFWEHYNDRAARKDDWKIIGRIGKDSWELYDLATDRCEQNDLAKVHPEIVQDLSAAWTKWATNHQVLPRFLGTSPAKR